MEILAVLVCIGAWILWGKSKPIKKTPILAEVIGPPSQSLRPEDLRSDLFQINLKLKQSKNWNDLTSDQKKSIVTQIQWWQDCYGDNINVNITKLNKDNNP